jgi:hypothetical protein
MLSSNDMTDITEQEPTGLGVRPHPSASFSIPTMPHDVSSHNREREFIQAPGTPDWYLYALAAVVVLGFFALTVTMILRDIPQNSQNIAYMLLGGLVTGFSMVLSYFFGSSAGSA